MELRRGFSFLLVPTATQRSYFARSAGCSRLIWNTALDLQTQRQKDGLPLLSFYQLSPLLKLWKREKPFLKEAPSQALQQRLIELSRAIEEAKDPKNIKQFPRFKKKGEDDSFRYPQHTELDQKRCKLFLPKLGWVKYVNSQEVVGTIKNVTISLKAGRWYVSIQTEQEVEAPNHPSTSIVGGDLGVVHFLTLSDGTHYDAPDYKPLELKIEQEQRKLSRKHKGGKNYNKQKVRLQRAHKKLCDTRSNFQHKLSNQLSKNHAVIVVERLRVRNMMKSARGSLEEPGKNVRQKAGLNRSISRQGWSEFRRQLEYKCAWRGGRFVTVAPEYTSQSCSSCGYAAPQNRKTQALFCCVQCGHAENADANAAKNILAMGLLEIQKPKEEKKKRKTRKIRRTAGQAGVACCEPVGKRAQKREPNTLKASQ